MNLHKRIMKYRLLFHFCTIDFVLKFFLLKFKLRPNYRKQWRSQRGVDECSSRPVQRVVISLL
ncbi:hypothetical protein BpHYR1_011874 [Brachionus plicatilis]|uniref:Uncharacterized protein n=1 Tax=Brachionus plicatilis TaxID=10195 RepID=A0A3M7SYV6_BRAPC|nr:hypothetical protein BpHYR1_011874 [Brachionus plicatilis]